MKLKEIGIYQFFVIIENGKARVYVRCDPKYSEKEKEGKIACRQVISKEGKGTIVVDFPPVLLDENLEVFPVVFDNLPALSEE